MWVLGGEVIRDLNKDPSFRKCLWTGFYMIRSLGAAAR
jgi:hypothetical protein